jgi:hypothetical protein
VQLVGLDLLALHAEHPGQLPRVRGEQRRHAQRSGDVGQPVGVNDDRHAVGERVGQRLLGVGAASGADHPGLHPTGADDDLGVLVTHEVGRSAEVAHHPHEPGAGS